METIQVDLFSVQVHMALFTHFTNSIHIRNQLIQASQSPLQSDRDRLNWAFVDAKMIVSKEHILTAIYQVMISESNQELKTKTLHSEILWALSPGNNIMDSIKRFGIGPETKDVLLVKLIPKSEATLDPSVGHLEQEARELIDGRLVNLDSLGSDEIVDMKAIRKIYKLNQEPLVVSLDKKIKDSTPETLRQLRCTIDQLVVSAVALKPVAN